MPCRPHETAVSFQQVMDKALAPVQDVVVVYIDDILVFNLSWDQHLEHLCRVFVALHAVGLTANETKSHLHCCTIQCLGFRI